MHKKVADRIKAGLKRFVPVLEGAKKRDVSEADTVHIIHDMLAEIFGWDKYADVTSEHAIRGTYCDLAIRDGSRLRFLLEAKAIDVQLKENHLRQAMDYAAKEGVDWVVLSNGIQWQVHKMVFEKPVRNIHIFTVDFLAEKANEDLLGKLYTLCKESTHKLAIEEFAARKAMVNKFVLAALLTTEAGVDFVRKEVRKLDPNIKVAPEEVISLLKNEVIKRELVEGEDALNAQKLLKKVSAKNARQKTKVVVGSAVAGEGSTGVGAEEAAHSPASEEED